MKLEVATLRKRFPYPPSDYELMCIQGIYDYLLTQSEAVNVGPIAKAVGHSVQTTNKILGLVVYLQLAKREYKYQHYKLVPYYTGVKYNEIT